MDRSFIKNKFSSLKLNPYGTELVKDVFRKFRTSPVVENERITLSTDEQTLHLDPDDLDETVLRNILYCYNFLDSEDKEYVNSAEAEVLIRQVKDQNPPLFDLLFDVLQVVSEYSSNDTNIAKNLFISRLREHVKKLKPDDNTSVQSLKSPSNAISDYFKNLDLGSSNPFHSEKSPLQQVSVSKLTPFQSELLSSAHLVESNDSPLHLHQDNQPQKLLTKSPENRLVSKYENANKFESVVDLEKVLNCNNNVDEFIVFNYNNQFEWEESLRELC